MVPRRASSAHPRVVVLHDHKPVAGATIDVYRGLGNSHRAILHLRTDKTGIAVFPQLRPGYYVLEAEAKPGYAGALILTVSLRTHDNARPFPLDADESVPGSPPWREERREWQEAELAAAKQAPVAATIRQFQLRMLDQTGAVIESAEAQVRLTSFAGATEIPVFHSDKDGRIVATLEPGDYVAIFSAPGFEDRTLHFVISPSGDGAEQEIALRIGSVN